MIALCILLVLQAACLLVLLFGDIGFDKAGKYGLDYDAFVYIGVVYAGTLIAGIIVALYKKRKLIALIQLVPICCSVVFVFLPYSKYDATKYQDLVGKSREAVVQRIGHPRSELTGAQSTDNFGYVDTISVRGMDIFLSRQGLVLSVQPNQR